MVNPVDVAMAAMASRQAGAFADRQVKAAGGDAGLIRRRLRSGVWARPAPGVLSFPGRRASFIRSLWIALLAAGEGAVVSHRSAAALHAMTGYARNRFDITVPHGARLDNPIAVVHQTRQFPDVVLVSGLPCTTIEQTVVDLGKVSSVRRLGAAVEDLILEGRSTLERMRRVHLSRACQGRNGITVVRTVLEDRGPERTVPRGHLEKALDAILVTIPGVPPRHEAPLPGREWSNERVDRRFEDPKLIVEGDGRRWHARTADFTRDRQRDRVALVHGYPTVRYAYEELVGDAAGVRAELRELLGR